MSCSDMIVRAEKPTDANDITHLHEQAFGPGRFAKTAYRLREGARPVASLSLVAVDKQRLVGSVRFTDVEIGGRRGALLLGPLAVYKEYSGFRCGVRLVRHGLELAVREGFELAFLVGDLSYYQRLGFQAVPIGQIQLPGPFDPGRLLAADLIPDALPRFCGMATL